MSSNSVEYQRAASRKSYLKRKKEVKQRAKEWNAKQAEILRAIIYKRKLDPCMDCGEAFHPEAMEFDHVRGEKKFHISTASSQGRCSVKTLVDELEKCELVCANCHRVRTYERRHAGRAGRGGLL